MGMSLLRSTPGQCGLSMIVSGIELTPLELAGIFATRADPRRPLPYHQAYDVDRATGRAVLPACRKPGRSYDRRSFVVLPSAITAWLTGHHRAVPEPPVCVTAILPHERGRLRDRLHHLSPVADRR